MSSAQGLQQPGQGLEHAKLSCLAAVDRQQWNEALEQLSKLRELIVEAGDGPALAGPDPWQAYAELVNYLVHRIHPLITGISTDPPPLPLRADLCWRMHRLLLLHSSLPVQVPAWMAVVEEQIVRDGAQYWRELIGQNEQAGERALELFERLAQLLSPCPLWVQQAVDTLRALPLPEPGTGSGLRLGAQGLQQPGQGLEHAKLNCLAAVDRQQWNEVLEQLSKLRELIAETGDGPALAGPDPWQAYAELVNYLVHRIHPLITGISTDPPPLPQRADLCWRMHRLLLLHSSLPVQVPAWMAVVEEQFVRDGALYWYDLIGQNEQAGERALELFERLAQLLSPCPLWVQQAVDTLRSLPPPGPGTGSGLRLGLVIRPGAAPVLQGAGRLDLNLGATLQKLTGDTESLEQLLDRYFSQVAAMAPSGELEAEDATTSLIQSVNMLWRLGEELNLEQFERLAAAAIAWTQRLGPSGLNANSASSPPPPLQLSNLPLALELDANELALLQRVLLAPDSLSGALDRLQRGETSQLGLGGSPGSEGLGSIDTAEALQRFHQEAGFYASRSEPMKSLECWSEGALACLTSVALWGEGAVWAKDRTTPWLYLPVAQAIASGSGRLQSIHRPPELEQIHGRMADEEVLYLGPLAEAVQEQHRSGNSLRLYHDLEIKGYGLRCLAPPESRPPQRPHGGFESSLEHCLQAVERLQGQTSFSLALVEAGAYRLPLCAELRRRFGLACLGLGPQQHQLFGLELPGDPLRGLARRSQKHWRRLSHAF